MSARAAFVGLTLLAAPLEAMSIRTEIEFLAWSDDAKAAAFSERRDGPEGGGSMSLFVAEFATGKRTRYTFGSDFSPGGATHPQTITAKECEEALRQAGEELARLRIIAVQLSDATCKSLEARYEPIAATNPGEQAVWTPTKVKPELVLENAKLAWKAGVTTASTSAGTSTSTVKVAHLETDTPYFEIFRAPHDAAFCVTAGSSGLQPVVVFREKNALKTLRIGS